MLTDQPEDTNVTAPHCPEELGLQSDSFLRALDSRCSADEQAKHGIDPEETLVRIDCFIRCF